METSQSFDTVKRIEDADFSNDYLIAAVESEIISIDCIETEGRAIINLSPIDAISLGEFLVYQGKGMKDCE